MNWMQMILGILMFAVVTAILYAWGLGKSMDQEKTLRRNLMNACGSKVLKQLKKQETMTEKEIANVIDGTKVGQFWSRHKIQVQDGRKVSGEVIRFLMEQQYIESAGKGVYRLKK